MMQVSQAIGMLPLELVVVASILVPPSMAAPLVELVEPPPLVLPLLDPPPELPPPDVEPPKPPLPDVDDPVPPDEDEDPVPLSLDEQATRPMMTAGTQKRRACFIGQESTLPWPPSKKTYEVMVFCSSRGCCKHHS
jgi:hypothetical protein